MRKAKGGWTKVGQEGFGWRLWILDRRHEILAIHTKTFVFTKQDWDRAKGSGLVSKLPQPLDWKPAWHSSLREAA